MGKVLTQIVATLSKIKIPSLLITIGIIYAVVISALYFHEHHLLSVAVAGTNADKQQFASTIAGLNKQIADSNKLVEQYRSTIANEQRSIDKLKQSISGLENANSVIQGSNSAIAGSNNSISTDVGQARQLIQGAISNLKQLESASR